MKKIMVTLFFFLCIFPQQLFAQAEKQRKIGSYFYYFEAIVVNGSFHINGIKISEIKSGIKYENESIGKFLKNGKNSLEIEAEAGPVSQMNIKICKVGKKQNECFVNETIQNEKSKKAEITKAEVIKKKIEFEVNGLPENPLWSSAQEFSSLDEKTKHDVAVKTLEILKLISSHRTQEFCSALKLSLATDKLLKEEGPSCEGEALQVVLNWKAKESVNQENELEIFLQANRLISVKNKNTQKSLFTNSYQGDEVGVDQFDFILTKNGVELFHLI